MNVARLDYQGFVNNNRESDWYISGQGARYDLTPFELPKTKEEFIEKYGKVNGKNNWNKLKYFNLYHKNDEYKDEYNEDDDNYYRQYEDKFYSY